jgi:type IV pilus assembly protein PilM
MCRFPLKEVVWDYELIEGAADKEVVIVAIKSDALDEINSAVNECGLGTAEVDVAPMALYNAFRSTYGQSRGTDPADRHRSQDQQPPLHRGQALFHPQHRHRRLRHHRRHCQGIQHSFSDAEHQKISNGLVALGGGHTEQLDEAVAALAMVIRNALSRLPAEIARTTNYYRSQHGGSAPRRILLAGGGANLPYTLEFFQEKLNLPVEYFNPVRNLAIGKGVDPAVVQREGHLMGELVGLGLRGIGKSEINIDLVPAVVEQARAADRRKPFLIAAAAVLLAGMGAWAAFQNVAAGSARDLARTMAEQRDSLAPVKSEIDALLKKEAALRQIAEAYTGVESDHAFWMDLLAELRGAFASDAVWLTDLEPIHGYDPFMKQPAEAPAGRKAPNGRSVVKPDFANAKFGASSLADIQVQAPQPQRGQQAPAPAVASANAVRIKGFWRENPRSQNIVSILLNNLREKSSGFRFTVKGPNGADVVLSDEQILDITVTGKPGELGLPFEITLPLARKVAIK